MKPDPGRGTLMKTLASCVALVSPSGLTPGQAPLHGDVVLVAHRGGIVLDYPENTLAAFRRAIESGVDVIELDLRSTKDGQIVVLHDHTVNRTTNGRGAVAAMSLTELRKLDAGGGERIPTYEEVLQLVAGTGVLLLTDIKENPLLDRRKLVRLTEERNAVSCVIVGARTLDDLRAFRALNPDLRMLGFVKEVGDIQPFVQAGADIIRLWPEWIEADPGLIGRVHKSGKPVWALTGDAPREELEKLVQLGVDGIISDLPDVMIGLRTGMKKNCAP